MNSISFCLFQFREDIKWSLCSSSRRSFIVKREEEKVWPREEAKAWGMPSKVLPNQRTGAAKTESTMSFIRPNNARTG